MSKDSLGDRMKSYYENIERRYLTRRIPVILRVDGKAFHTVTRGMDRPFDMNFVGFMQATMETLCDNIQGCKLGYQQSDEISLLLTDYDTLTTQAWMNYNVQKMTSIAASFATVTFNRALRTFVEQDHPDIPKEYLTMMKRKVDKGFFDARVFNIPQDEVCNYFIWRQQDATRNSIEMAGRAYFSHKELHRVTCNQIQDKLMLEKGINWNDYPIDVKRGSCCVKISTTEPLPEEIRQKAMANKKPGSGPVAETVTRSRWVIDHAIPIFTSNRSYVEQYLVPQ